MLSSAYEYAHKSRSDSLALIHTSATELASSSDPMEHAERSKCIFCNVRLTKFTSKPVPSAIGLLSQALRSREPDDVINAATLARVRQAEASGTEMRVCHGCNLIISTLPRPETLPKRNQPSASPAEHAAKSKAGARMDFATGGLLVWAMSLGQLSALPVWFVFKRLLHSRIIHSSQHSSIACQRFPST